MPERVGIPGFRRGRRYRACDDGTRPEFFTLYEAESFEVLQGQDYADRLNARRRNGHGARPRTSRIPLVLLPGSGKVMARGRAARC